MQKVNEGVVRYDIRHGHLTVSESEGLIAIGFVLEDDLPDHIDVWDDAVECAVTIGPLPPDLEGGTLVTVSFYYPTPVEPPLERVERAAAELLAALDAAVEDGASDLDLVNVPSIVSIQQGGWGRWSVGLIDAVEDDEEAEGDVEDGEDEPINEPDQGDDDSWSQYDLEQALWTFAIEGSEDPAVETFIHQDVRGGKVNVNWLLDQMKDSDEKIDPDLADDLGIRRSTTYGRLARRFIRERKKLAPK